MNDLNFTLNILPYEAKPSPIGCGRNQHQPRFPTIRKVEKNSFGTRWSKYGECYLKNTYFAVTSSAVVDANSLIYTSIQNNSKIENTQIVLINEMKNNNEPNVIWLYRKYTLYNLHHAIQLLSFLSPADM